MRHDRKISSGGPNGAPAARWFESSDLVRRNEEKFEVGPAAATFLRDEISRYLPCFEFCAGHPFTWITTIYFDTEDRRLFRRAVRAYDDNLKVRIKEYAYRDASGGSITSPLCFLELKERRKGRVLKRRFPVPKSSLRNLLEGEDVWPQIAALAEGGTPPETVRKTYDGFRSFLTRYSVRSTAAIRYRRTVFQDPAEGPRVTFDDRITIHPAPRELYASSDPRAPVELGRAVRRYDRVILEIKASSCEYPDWLREILRNHQPRRLSKFTTSVRCLDGATGAEPPASSSRGRNDPPPSGAEGAGDTAIVNAPIEH